MDQTSRITISIPTTYLKRIKKVVPKRKISKTFKDAMDKHLTTLEKKGNAWEEFAALRGTLPPMSPSQIKRAIEKGRA